MCEYATWMILGNKIYINIYSIYIKYELLFLYIIINKVWYIYSKKSGWYLFNIYIFYITLENTVLRAIQTENMRDAACSAQICFLKGSIEREGLETRVSSHSHYEGLLRHVAVK